MTTPVNPVGSPSTDLPESGRPIDALTMVSDQTPQERAWQILENLEQLVAPGPAVDPQLDDLRALMHQLRGDLRPSTPAPQSADSDIATPFAPHHSESELLEIPRASLQRMRLLSGVFEETQLGAVILGADGIIREANTAFLAIADRTAARTAGESLDQVLEWAFPDYQEVLQSTLAGRAWTGRVVLAERERNERTYLLTFDPLPTDQEATCISVLFSDVTEIERTHRRLKRLALHDQLTGLPNRRYYRERVQSLIEAARSNQSTFAVCLVDLDNFKDINDSFGHTTGDEVLVHVAQRLQQHAPPGAFVARLGGDEFAMLIPQSGEDLHEGEVIAQTLLQALLEPIEVDDTFACVSASVGITEYPTHSTDIDQLLQNADVAMYAAKKTGRNQVRRFAPEMRRQVEIRNKIQQELRRAVRGNEISLRYQAQVDLKTGCLTGCEALARWRTPDGREIMPNEFVPVAETSGLEVPLGEVVLMEACRQACEWEAMDVRPPQIAINISPQHLHSRDFSERVADILAATTARPEWLVLEITEEAVMQDVPRAMQTMDALVEMGLSLAIDDFGTGRSSLSHLKQFNVQALKIDRSFISDVTTDPQATAIVESMIHLGQGRQLQIIAVGIENAGQYQRLSEMGCDIGQGFHIARPLRATALECWWDETAS